MWSVFIELTPLLNYFAGKVYRRKTGKSHGPPRNFKSFLGISAETVVYAQLL